MTRSPNPARRGVLGLLGLTAVAGGATACAHRGGAAPEAAYPPLGRIIEVDGLRTHVLDQGPPDAPAVVLIHGASGNLRDFSFSFMERLSPDYRAIAIDRPGFGHSDRGPDAEGADAPHRPDRQARRMRAALRALGVERAILVGHSFGGAPALAWALDAPETVRGVVNLAAVSHPWAGGAGLLYDLGASAAAGLVTGLIRTFVSEAGAIEEIDRIFRPQRAPAGYGAYVGVGLALRPATLRANAEDVSELKSFLEAQRPRYRDLRPPIELVHGEADRIVHARTHAQRLAREAPDANLTLLGGVGHMPHHVAAEVCRAAIDRVAARAPI